jgi:ubiquinone/menaquinone biosynthesis C-methylase UbiE
VTDKIKEYWDDRARQHSYCPAATTDDVYLRDLEISTLIQTIREVSPPIRCSILDVGCGDGYSTLKIVQAFEDFSFIGVDFSENMINIARRRLDSYPNLKSRIRFLVGDVRELDKTCGSSLYDVVISDRCLINLDSFEKQALAISQIAAHTKPGGHYIAIENFIEGQENMNAARRQVGLPEIPIRWHNLYFYEDQFIQSAARFFQGINFKDFASSYYFATRVIYSAMCQMRGEKIDYFTYKIILIFYKSYGNHRF